MDETYLFNVKSAACLSSSHQLATKTTLRYGMRRGGKNTTYQATQTSQQQSAIQDESLFSSQEAMPKSLERNNVHCQTLIPLLNFTWCCLTSSVPAKNLFLLQCMFKTKQNKRTQDILKTSEAKPSGYHLLK